MGQLYLLRPLAPLLQHRPEPQRPRTDHGLRRRRGRPTPSPPRCRRSGSRDGARAGSRRGRRSTCGPTPSSGRTRAPRSARWRPGRSAPRGRPRSTPCRPRRTRSASPGTCRGRSGQMRHEGLCRGGIIAPTAPVQQSDSIPELVLAHIDGLLPPFSLTTHPSGSRISASARAAPPPAIPRPAPRECRDMPPRDRRSTPSEKRSRSPPEAHRRRLPRLPGYP